MKVTSVKKYKVPKHPCKQLVLDNPLMLKMNLPHRWKNNIKAITALSALLAITASSCGKVLESINPADDDNLVAAPIFEHGDGRGSYGCMAVNAPVFLSEEEALDIIYSEAQKMGISLKRDKYVLKNVEVPITSYREEKPVIATHKDNLELDGVDKQLKIGIEYVSREDYKAWEGERERSTLSHVDILSTAKKLHYGIENASKDITVGIFYDPMFRLDKETYENDKITNEEIAALRHENAVELLRNQVKDFLEWLKGEGII